MSGGATQDYTVVQVDPSVDRSAIRSRQADLVDSMILTIPVTIIGAGAIGSFVTMTLAKMGFKYLTVWDDDEVSTENISNQFYRYRDIGEFKVDALRAMVKDFEGLDINNVTRRFVRSNHPLVNEVVISCVDSMAVRKEIYDHIKRNANVSYFVDGRMGGQQAEVYTVDLLNTAQKKFYESRLWTDDEASELPCTQKAIMYNVLWIASQIANNLRLMLEEKPFPPCMLMDFENVNHMNVQPEV